MLLATLAFVALALGALLAGALAGRRRVLATIAVVDATHRSLEPASQSAHDLALRSASLHPERAR